MSISIPNIDLTQLLPHLLTIVGWFAAFWFGVNQQKINIRTAARLKVYEDIWKQQGDLQDAIASLAAELLSGPPFILMGLPDLRAGIDPDGYAPIKAQEDAEKYYREYFERLLKSRSSFEEKFMDFWRSIEMWIHVMPDLETAKKTLTSEYEKTSETLNKLISFHQSLHIYEWRNWNQELIKKQHDHTWEETSLLGCYIFDMMNLVHNELVVPVFKHPKEQRRPTDLTLKVLSREGLMIPKS